MKRTTSIIWCIMLIFVITSCAPKQVVGTESSSLSDETVGNPPATWSNLSWMNNTTPVIFSVFIDEAHSMAAEQGWGNDPISEEVTRLTGVSLKPYCAALGGVITASYEKNLDVMIATGSMTDFVFTENDVERFHDANICYPWDELISEYCPELLDLVDPLELINNQAADGHFYTLKTEYFGEQVYQDSNCVIAPNEDFSLAYRADILEKLGIPPFTSVEMLDDTLYRVKEKAAMLGVETILFHDPESENILPYAMGCQTQVRWNEEKQSVTTQYTDSTWLEYYKLMNRWYRDKILPVDYPYMDRISTERLYSSTRVFATLGSLYYANSVNKIWRNGIGGGKIDDLSKPVYERVASYLTYHDKMQVKIVDYDTGKSSFFITRSCSKPDRAICFVEFLKSPQGDKLTNWGIENVHYIYDEEGWRRPDEEKANRKSVAYMVSVGNGRWNFQNSLWSDGIRLCSYDHLDSDDEYELSYHEKALGFIKEQKILAYENKNPAMSYARILREDPEYSILEKIEKRWDSLNAELIHANSETQVEILWEEFQQYLMVNGIDAIESKLTQRYLANLSRYKSAGYYADVETNR